MPVVIVLGMHRSRTSMVAHICQSLGVHIGEHLLGAHPSQPKGHFEDVDFYQMNQIILQGCGGKWDDPPSVHVIERNANRFRGSARLIVESKSHRQLWGWKDPRTCLTLPVYLPFLEDPRVVLVYRDVDSVIKSLIRRSGGDYKKWRPVVDLYYEGMAWAASQRMPVIEIDTDLSVSDRFGARMQVRHLSEHIEGNGKIDRAMKVIEFSE